MEENLVFDIGMHRGEDSEFYLKKGFRVIGVEANQELCEEVIKKYQSEIQRGQLTIINKAIAQQPGRVKFYLNTKLSVWGTLLPEWAERNSRLGADSTECEVEATTMAALIDEFGTPYYAKIDIEGNDLLAVEGLANRSDRPKYVSIESDKDSFRAVRREISTLSALGYQRFKIVDQSEVTFQRAPKSPKEGKYADHLFEEGSSGLFGAELPGPWLTADETIEAYRPIFLRYALAGDDPFVTNSLARRVLRKVLRNAGFKWYDTHAMRE